MMMVMVMVLTLSLSLMFHSDLGDRQCWSSPQDSALGSTQSLAFRQGSSLLHLDLYLLPVVLSTTSFLLLRYNTCIS